MNAYVYVSSNPVSYIDSSGLVWETIRVEAHNMWSQLGQGGFLALGNGMNYLFHPTDDGPTDPYCGEVEPNIFLGSQQTTVQEWVDDPDKPERNEEYPFGTRREVNQNYIERLIGPESLSTPESWSRGSTIRWDPVVANHTYVNYPEQRIYYPTIYSR